MLRHSLSAFRHPAGGSSSRAALAALARPTPHPAAAPTAFPGSRPGSCDPGADPMTMLPPSQSRRWRTMCRSSSRSGGRATVATPVECEQRPQMHIGGGRPKVTFPSPRIECPRMPCLELSVSSLRDGCRHPSMPSELLIIAAMKPIRVLASHCRSPTDPAHSTSELFSVMVTRPPLQLGRPLSSRPRFNSIIRGRTATSAAGATSEALLEGGPPSPAPENDKPHLLLVDGMPWVYR